VVEVELPECSDVIEALARPRGGDKDPSFLFLASGVPARLGLKAAALAWPEGAPAF
jgi:hypothetical protein